MAGFYIYVIRAMSSYLSTTLRVKFSEDFKSLRNHAWSFAHPLF